MFGNEFLGEFGFARESTSPISSERDEVYGNFALQANVRQPTVYSTPEVPLEWYDTFEHFFPFIALLLAKIPHFFKPKIYIDTPKTIEGLKNALFTSFALIKFTQQEITEIKSCVPPEKKRSDAFYKKIDDLQIDEFKYNNETFSLDEIQKLEVFFKENLTLHKLIPRLVKTSGAIKRFKMEHNSNLSPGEVSDLKLLIIPLIVNNGTKQGENNHHTLLVIDLENERYYYQDSFGLRSDYGEAYRSVHDVMAVFFGRKKLLEQSKSFRTPPKIDEYKQTVEQYGTAEGQPRICINYECYKQQLNDRDCGPAVIDNILAVLKAYVLGWSSLMFPAIIQQRCHSWGFEDYQHYYQKIREEHQEWLQGKFQTNFLMAERNQVKLQQRQKFSAMILSRPAHGSLNAYYSDLFKAFSDVIEYDLLINQLSALDIIITKKISTPEAVKQLGALTRGLMGKIINRKWFSDSDMVDASWLTKHCEEYIMAIQQRASSHVLVQPRAKFLVHREKIVLSASERRIEYNGNFGLTVWNSLPLTIKRFLKEFQLIRPKKIIDWKQCSDQHINCFNELQTCFKMVFPRYLMNDNQEINATLRLQAEVFFANVLKNYEALAKNFDEKLKWETLQECRNKHKKILDVLEDTEIDDLVYLKKYKEKAGVFIKIFQGKDSSCTIS